MKRDITDIISYINENFNNDVKDLTDSLDLVNLSLDGILESANIKLTQYHKEKQYEEGIEILNFSKELAEIQEKLCELTLLLNDADNEEDVVAESDIEQEKKEIPNYSQYAIDDKIPHTLYEDFTHKKASGFSIEGMFFVAKDWKDVLMQTCNILSERDTDKFYGFIDDPTMRGRKVAYFGNQFIETESGIKNAKMDNVDVFVWTNLSSNHIRNIIRKLLKKFGIKITDYTVFLRADYTPLHPNIEKENQPPEGLEKIGKHVRIVMRGISDKKYIFSDNELTAMQSSEWCKEELGLYQPLIRKYVDGVDISEQILVNTYPRYWKEIFEFNGEKFLVSSQWYERFRESFDKWAEKIK